MIMALTTMITMHACSKVNHDTANEVCTALSEKYGEEFEVVRIGDRFNTDHAKLYVHPADNEELLFIAHIERDTGEVTDNYVTEKVNYEIEVILQKAFYEEGITTKAICMVVTRNELDVENKSFTPESFMAEYGFENYMIYLIVEENGVTARKICAAMQSAGERVKVKMVVIGYVFDEAAYAECTANMKQYPQMSTTMIEKCGPVVSFSMTADKGELSVPEEELSKILEGA